MKFIVVDIKRGKSLSFNSNGFLISLTIVGLLGIPMLVAFQLDGFLESDLDGQMIERFQDVLNSQQTDVDTAVRMSAEGLSASTVRLAMLQARMDRLDALGERLATMADLDDGEFDFSRPPALGGPLPEGNGESHTVVDYMQLLDMVTAGIENKEQQLGVMEDLLVDRKSRDDLFISGRPIQKGWMSSAFGSRNDPITGRKAWHSGVDFAGREGSDVVAVAAGLVVYAGPRSSYGQMIEINHGNGFKTRYGHHKQLHVNVGDVVTKGQVIGSMGSSGRSTGPHVHFEVYRNGRLVDPSSYIHRTSR